MEELKAFIDQYFKSHGFNTYWLPIYADLLGLYSRILNTEYTKPYVQEYLTAISLSAENKGDVAAHIETCRSTILGRIDVPQIGCSSGTQGIEAFLFWAIEDVHARCQSEEMAKLSAKLKDLERDKQRVLEAMEKAMEAKP